MYKSHFTWVYLQVSPAAFRQAFPQSTCIGLQPESPIMFLYTVYPHQLPEPLATVSDTVQPLHFLKTRASVSMLWARDSQTFQHQNPLFKMAVHQDTPSFMRSTKKVI